MKKCFPVLLIVLMAALFLFSAQGADETNAVSYRFCRFAARMIYVKYDEYDPATQELLWRGLNSFIRKAAHFSLYAGMGFLGYLWLRRKEYNISTVMSSVFLFAALDEFHQTFVPGRTGLVSDIFLDCLGAACGVFAAYLLLSMQYCRRRKQVVEKGVWKQ